MIGFDFQQVTTGGKIANGWTKLVKYVFTLHTSNKSLL